MTKATVSIVDWITVLTRLAYSMIAYGMIHLFLMSKAIVVSSRQMGLKSIKGTVYNATKQFEYGTMNSVLQRHLWQGPYIKH